MTEELKPTLSRSAPLLRLIALAPQPPDRWPPGRKESWILCDGPDEFAGPVGILRHPDGDRVTVALEMHWPLPVPLDGFETKEKALEWLGRAMVEYDRAVDAANERLRAAKSCPYWADGVHAYTPYLEAPDERGNMISAPIGSKMAGVVAIPRLALKVCACGAEVRKR